VSVTNATFLFVGDLLRIDSEFVRVTGISANNLTLLRGQQGTTASAHSSGAAVWLATDQRGIVRQTNPDLGAFDLGQNGSQLNDTTPIAAINGVEGAANINVVVMTFTDTAAGAVASDFSVTSVNWNGTLVGTTPALKVMRDPSYVGSGSGWKVVADNVTYAEAGAYSVVLTVRDASGHYVSTGSGKFNVADAALTDTTPSQTINATQGVASTNVVLMTFTDANPFATGKEFSIRNLNWGGVLRGTSPTISVVRDSSYTGPGSGWKVIVDTVTYAASGAYTVSLTVHDAYGNDVSTSNTHFNVTNSHSGAA
jgi:hypothetical protein